MQKTLISIIIVLLLSACENQGGEGSPNQNTNIDTRPNIILIVADDMGYSDIGSFGGEISTPNLDELAAGGVRLSNFYAASTCSPTRSMLLSGVSNHKAGMGTMFGDQAPNQLGQKGYEGHMNFKCGFNLLLLKDAGYHTYMTGKWHLGYEEELSPKARGFEQSFVLLNGGAGHFDDSPLENTYDKASFRDNGLYTSLPDDFYSSEFYTDKLIEYIDNNQNDGKPFFGYLAYTAPHWPLQAPDEYIEKYKGKYDDGYNNLKERRLQSMVNLGLTEGVDIVPLLFSGYG